MRNLFEFGFCGRWAILCGSLISHAGFLVRLKQHCTNIRWKALVRGRCYAGLPTAGLSRKGHACFENLHSSHIEPFHSNNINNNTMMQRLSSSISLKVQLRASSGSI